MNKALLILRKNRKSIETLIPNFGNSLKYFFLFRNSEKSEILKEALSIWVSDSHFVASHGDGGMTDLDGHRQQVQHITVPLPAVILYNWSNVHQLFSREAAEQSG